MFQNTVLLLKMGWRNLWRQKRRSLITLSAMASGLALCIPTYGLIVGMTTSMTKGITRMHLGDIQIHNPKWPEEKGIRQTIPFDDIYTRLKRKSGIIGVAPRIYSGGMISSDEEIELTAVWDKKVNTGEGNDEEFHCKALISEKASKKYRLTPGSTLLFKPVPVSLNCGTLKISGIRHGDYADNEIFVSENIMRALGAENPEGKTQEKSTDDDSDIDNLKKLPAVVDSASKKENPEGKTQEKSTDDDSDIDNLKKLPAVVDKNEKTIEKRKLSFTRIKKKIKWRFVRTKSAPVGIMGILPSEEKLVTNSWKTVIKGSYLNDNPSGKYPEILIGNRLAETLNVKVGDRIGMDSATSHFYPMDRFYTVCGIFKTGSTSVDRSVVLVHIKNGWDKDLMDIRYFEGKDKTLRGVHEFAVHVKEPSRNSSYISGIKEVTKDVAVVRTWQQIDRGMAMMIKTTDAMTSIILMIILIIAAFGTMNTMLMSVIERIREFGVLKSIGMKPNMVARLIIFETFLMSLAASIVGTAIGVALNSYLVNTGLDLRSVLPDGFTFQGVVLDPVWRGIWTIEGIAIPVILLFVISMLVSIWPAVRAARIKPVEAFRQTIG
ncbi:MAG: ABC transporter permease [Deltaproteobacteria bacterium]|nr:ABC transporter permease [Deltaproteobacteria bacterium]